MARRERCPCSLRWPIRRSAWRQRGRPAQQLPAPPQRASPQPAPIAFWNRPRPSSRVEAAVAAGAVAVAAGAAFGGGGSARSATLLSSSRCFDLKPLKSNPESERPGADTLRQDSELQSFGASMWIFCPLISKEIELPA